jgi:hypothetical protein
VLLAQVFITASAVIILFLGVVHLGYTFFTPFFRPRDPDLEQRLMSDSPMITSETTMWNAFISFNASHSLGAILFGLVYGYLALRHIAFLVQSDFLLFLGLLVLGSYLLLAKLYWFRVPFRGIAIASGCYVLGFFFSLF